MKRLSVLLAFFAMMCCAAQAQHASFYFNVVQPVGFFAQKADLHNVPGYPALTRSDIGSDAITGVGGNYRYAFNFDVMSGQLMPSFEVGFYWNRIRRSDRNEIEELRGSSPNYFNLPFMVNLTYMYPIKSNIDIFGEFGLGYDLLFITREGIDNQINDFRYTAKGGFAWQLGGGVMLSKHFSIGLHFYSFGRHCIDYSSSTSDQESKTLAYATGDDLTRAKFRTLNSLMLRLGFHF